MQNFFLDIDGTITDLRTGKALMESQLVAKNPVFGVIRDTMVEEGWKPEEAKKKIEDYADKVIWWDYPDFIAEFGLPHNKTWQRIYDWHSEYLMVYEDAVELIKSLHSKGKNLFIVSNNPIVACLLKLKRAQLGDITGSPYFKRILGANILRGQKHQKQLWEKAIAQIGINPVEIANIGDDENQDGDVPISAGIAKAFLVKRNLDGNPTGEEKKIFVKSATDVLEYIAA
jgi:FMN phosphatase YigB (HAD superfamily)